MPHEERGVCPARSRRRSRLTSNTLLYQLPWLPFAAPRESTCTTRSQGPERHRVAARHKCNEHHETSSDDERPSDLRRPTGATIISRRSTTPPALTHGEMVHTTARTSPRGTLRSASSSNGRSARSIRRSKRCPTGTPRRRPRRCLGGRTLARRQASAMITT